MIDYIQSEARLPGWTILKNPETKSYKYRAPSGDIVGAWAYKSAQTHFERTGVVPQEPLGSKWKSHQKNQGRIYSSKQPVDNDEPIEIPIPGMDETLLVDLPDAKNTTASHRKSGLFTSKELSTGFQSILVIATSILAMALQLPEAQMTDVEVKAISIPLGNMTERSRYNRVVGQMIVDKVDYLQLGYALYMYFDRVSSAAKERRSDKSTGNVSQNQRTTGSNGRATIPEPGAYIRAAPSGLRNFTGGN